MRGCRRGKRQYQKALYDRYASTLLGVCFRYFPDEDKANDLLQEVFITVFDKLSTFREEGSLEGWMKRIAVNKAINEIRKQQRKFHEEGLEEHLNIVGEVHDDSYDLFRMIADLPDGQREIFNLHAIEGYKFKEIGELMNLTENNVRVRYYRVRQKLQSMLQAYFLK